MLNGVPCSPISVEDKGRGNDNEAKFLTFYQTVKKECVVIC